MDLATSALEALWFGDDDLAVVERAAAASASAALAGRIGLKPFPKAAHEALRQLDAPEVDFAALDRTFQTDPCLSARVLKLANSGYYHSARPCRTILDAVVRIGANQLRDLVAAAAVHGMFRDLGGAGDTLLQHSVSVGAIGRIIANRLGLEQAPAIYLAGLMHDVGKLLLVQAKEQLSGAAFDDAIVHERTTRGFDHAILGAQALRSWAFPEPLPEIVALHHQPARAYGRGGEVATMVAVVRLADRLEHEIGWCRLSDEDALAMLAASPDAAYLRLTTGDLSGIWTDAQRARFDARAASA